MKSDEERTAPDKYPGIEESAVFEDDLQESTSKQHLHVATNEEIRQAVCKVNPDVNTSERG